MKKMTKVFGLLVVLAMLVSMFAGITVNAAKEPSAIYYFDEAVNPNWVPENAGIDQAFQFWAGTSSVYNKCYNISWASRFGGFAFKGVDLNLKISANKNRFVVLSLRADETAVNNYFDKLGIYLQVDGGAAASLTSQSPAAAGTYGQAFSVLHDANPQEFQKIVIDLMWPFETEKTLNMLRFDMFSSDKAHSAAGADAADAYNCGAVHFKYIAFFDTLEDANAFQYPAPIPADQLHGASFDSFYVDNTLNFGEPDGGASAKLDARNRTVDGSDGLFNTIKLRGWIGFESEIDQFGYKINDNDPVFGDFKEGTEDAVKLDGNGGAYASRFSIVIPVADLKGTNEIVAVVKLANGMIIEIDENVLPNGAGTAPNTSFTFVGPDEGATAKAIEGTIIGAHDGQPSVWLGNNNPLSRSVSFKTAKGFSGISFPATWGIGGDGYTLTVSVEQNGAKVAETAYTEVGDKGAITVDFGKYIPAGDTKITVSVADGTYFVFSSLTQLADNYQLTYDPAGNFAFDLVFAEAPAETEAPQTGDVTVAMFAVIAVVALAAVVVLKKRVNG